MRLKKDSIFKLFKDWAEETSKDMKRATTVVLPKLWERAYVINSKYLSDIDRDLLQELEKVTKNIKPYQWSHIVESSNSIRIRPEEVLEVIRSSGVEYNPDIKLLLKDLVEEFPSFIRLDISYFELLRNSKVSDVLYLNAYFPNYKSLVCSNM